MVDARTGSLLIDAALAGEWDVFRNAVSHIALPAAILGYYSVAYLSRMTRSFMLDQLSQEYIVTARAKGLSERRVIWRHAFGNIMVPLLTVIALTYSNLLEGSVLTEIVFAWPSRLVPDRRTAERRHERGARRDARDRRDVHHRQPADRRAVPRVRSAMRAEGRHDMTASTPLLSSPMPKVVQS